MMNKDKIRVIKTARTLEAINQATKNGFEPLVKKVVPSDKIYTKYCVYQNLVSGEIHEINDFREVDYFEKKIHYKLVIDWTNYYPYIFENPYAAYLIPLDIVVGERVFLEDLIEDLVGMSWNQGNSYRLETCEAIWNGEDFELDYNPDTSISYTVG